MVSAETDGAHSRLPIRRAADRGKAQLPEGIVAESWEVSDYRDTTGTVVNGALRGRTLHQLVVDYPEELVGLQWRGPHFPLLEKFLDASHMLPVHLHADDETRALKSRGSGTSARVRMFRVRAGWAVRCPVRISHPVRYPRLFSALLI